MARRDVKNAKQFNYEIDAALADEFRAFCQARGESIKDHLEIALRRHLDSPPPPLKPQVPPLPPLVDQAVVKTLSPSIATDAGGGGLLPMGGKQSAPAAKGKDGKK